MVAVQPNKIDRTDYFTVAGKKREYLERKHMFGKLKEIMKLFKHRHVMRVNVEINNLIELTQNDLDNKTNQRKSERKNYIVKRKKSVPEELYPKLQKNSIHKSIITQVITQKIGQDHHTKVQVKNKTFH